VSTDFVNLEKVDFLFTLVHMEVPNAVDLSTKTVNWLISLNECDLFGGEVVNQAYDSNKGFQ